MSELSQAGGAFLAVFRRDLHVYVSYRTRMVSQLLTSVFSLTLFYYISRLVNVSGFASPNQYFGFVVVGIALVSVLYSCFAIAEQVRQELIAGTFERFLLSPFGAVAGMVAMTLFPLLFAFVLAATTLGVGVVLFGLELHWATVPFAVPAMALALLSFIPFGLFFAAVTVATKQGNVGTSWFIALVSIVGGLYFPIELLPGWVQKISEVQPFTPATELLRHLLTDSPQANSTLTTVAKLAGFAIVLVPLSLLALREAIRYGQRRGTIIEY
ncbi:MAG TPA: ABC transporter permease [Solirubrobacterales bacterium]|nr:ABC transporter permease [Solirubrobacterales bacterium]